MRPFLASRRKIIELVPLLVLDIVLGLLWSKEAVMLFSLGYIWNWTASQQLEFADVRRYRYSMINMIAGFQALAVRPVKKLPEPFKILPRILPAGLFWSVVIFFIESKMPWWATFLGSLSFELTQFETYFSRRKEETAL